MWMEPRHETIECQQQTWLFWVQSDITKVGYKISKDHGVSNKREGSNKKNSGFNKSGSNQNCDPRLSKSTYPSRVALLYTCESR